MITRRRMEIIEEGAYSVDLNGVDEFFFNTTNQPVGFANAWSVGVWLKPGAGAMTNNQVVVDIKLTGVNNVLFMTRGNAATGRIRWFNSASTGAGIKRYDWNSALTQDTWQVHLATWDGTDLLAYKDGVTLGSPDLTPIDTTGTMTNTVRNVALGGRITLLNPFEGRLHSCLVWDVALSPAEILTLNNGGNGAGFDPLADSGNYASSANLEHWWKLGRNGEALGTDFATAGTPINVGQNAQNITIADDIVQDAPV